MNNQYDKNLLSKANFQNTKELVLLKVNYKKQEGAALFVALIMLLVLTVIGLSASQRSTLQEKMASNAHMQNVAFNAAESAMSAFLIETNGLNIALAPGEDFQGHLNDPLNPLFMVRNLAELVQLGPFCYDVNGQRGACGARFLDAGGSVESRVSIQKIRDCGNCPGYSISDDSSIGCRIYQITATGTVGGTVTEQHSLEATEISPGCS